MGGDFFTDDLPKVDVISLSNILHDWQEEKRKILLKRVYDSLNEGGVLTAIEAIIDSDRRSNKYALVTNLFIRIH